MKTYLELNTEWQGLYGPGSLGQGQRVGGGEGGPGNNLDPTTPSTLPDISRKNSIICASEH